MNTLERVQSAARVASRHVDGPARAVFMAFIDALEVEIEAEQLEIDRATAAFNAMDQEPRQ